MVFNTDKQEFEPEIEEPEKEKLPLWLKKTLYKIEKKGKKKMDKKQKQIIIIGAGVGAVSVFGVFGYWYYKKLKKQAKIDELLLEGESDLGEIYDLKNSLRSKFHIYSNVSDRFKILETVGDPKAKRETGRMKTAGNLYRKDTPSGYDRERERFRVSGNTRRADIIISEYGNNNRNKANISNITELDIPVNVPRKRIRSSLIYPELR